MNASLTPTNDLAGYCKAVAAGARIASRVLATVSTEVKNAWLRSSAKRLRDEVEMILEANRADVTVAPSWGLTEAQVDRLRLDQGRVDSIASGLEQVSDLSDPIGAVIASSTRPNGLLVERIRVPLGVIFFIYESRPNVTADAAAICVKSGNAVVLRGGKESANSSQAIVRVLQEEAKSHGLPDDAVQLVQTADRTAVDYFLSESESIDLVIPRGGESLIRRVVENATMPVLKHFSGNCHVYVDASADLGMALEIVANSKCQRMGVCNAAESLLVHADVAESFLPQVQAAFAKHAVEIRGDEAVRRRLESAVLATKSDYLTEFLGPIISVAVVDDVEHAIRHINQYGSKHTDAIVAADSDAIDLFVKSVDTAAVVVNASTRFHDGGELGLGAEIGISTDKFHARGPCGLQELTSYKWVVRGSGHVRK